MKRFLLQTMLMALPALAIAAEQTPYYSDMGSKAAGALDPAWKVVNLTEGSHTWSWDNTDNNQTALTGAATGAIYKYDNNNDADDWLISPSITLKTGVEYKVSYWMKTSNDTEDMDVYLATSDDPTVLSAGTKLFTYKEYKNSTWKKEIKVFTVAADGNYNVGFFIHSPKGHYNVYLRGFTLSENVEIPAAPTGFTAVAAPEQELKATLKWTLPTLDTDGKALANPLDGVVVSRDGKQIATLAGTATEFTDDATYGLESGFHNYEVYVTYGTQKSRSATAKTGYVGPVKPMPIPFECDFEDAEMWNLWTVIDVASDGQASGNPATGKWYRWQNTSLTGNIVSFKNPNPSVAEDDWLITPALRFHGAGKYYVTFQACMYSAANDKTCQLDFYLGTEANAAAMTRHLKEYTTFPSNTYPKNTNEVQRFEIEIEQPGAYYIGIHEHAAVPAQREVRLDNFAVEADPSVVPVGIDQAVAEMPYRIAGNAVLFSEEALTQVYSIAGVKVAERVADSIDLEGMAPGMYIVRHDNVTVKIAVR